MADFEHVLLTRFSVALHPGAPPQPEEWLWYRLGFFYDVTYPSVRAQRDAGFDWLVLFDDRCPDDVRGTVEELAADGTFTPVWTRAPFRRDTFATLLADRRPPWLITTRLDSDDALAVDFLAAVQARFARQDLEFVAFPRGLQLDRSGAVYRADYVSNPFLSLVERRGAGPWRTVYAAKHAEASGVAAVRVVPAPPMWLQVVHDLNVSNIVNGVRTSPAALGRFAITLPRDPDAAGAASPRARARDALRLLRLWRAHPGELARFVEGRVAGLRGTHVRRVGMPDLATRLQRLAGRGRRPAR